MEKKDKVTIKVAGEDGNIFAIMARCRRPMQRAGQIAEYEKMCNEVRECPSYDHALAKINEYVEFE